MKVNVLFLKLVEIYLWFKDMNGELFFGVFVFYVFYLFEFLVGGWIFLKLYFNFLEIYLVYININYLGVYIWCILDEF